MEYHLQLLWMKNTGQKQENSVSKHNWSATPFQVIVNEKFLKVNALKFWTLVALKNTADLDQTASEEAVWSGQSDQGLSTSNLWISALKTNILFDNRKRNFRTFIVLFF